jgi:lipoprotein NlpI
MRSQKNAVLVTTIVVALAALPSEDSVQDILMKSNEALAIGQRKEALALASQAVAAEPKNPLAHMARAIAHAALRERSEAIKDFTEAIVLDPKLAEAYNRRGAEYFKQGEINNSIVDFDKFIELRPDQMPGHWQRGISYYYAGRFEDGWKQFKAYEQKDTNDVENAVWHYLCLARIVGPDKARESLLKIGRDRRVPLMEVYALFKGDVTPKDVLVAAAKGNPSAAEKNLRLFYAHLYLGLYHESMGHKQKTLDHLTKAVEDYEYPEYMGDVARVHLSRIQKVKK